MQMVYMMEKASWAGWEVKGRENYREAVEHMVDGSDVGGQWSAGKWVLERAQSTSHSNGTHGCWAVHMGRVTCTCCPLSHKR